MATIKKIAFIITMGIAFSASASEAEINPSWYIQPNVKALRQASVFGVGRHGDGVGLVMGKAIDENWDIQLGTSYGRAQNNGDRYQQNLFGVDALYFMSRAAVRPFLLMGAGVTRDKLSAAGSPFDHDTAPYIDAGAGLQAQLSDQWSIQGDVRAVQTMHRQIADTRPRNVYATVGLNYSFGTKPAAPATPVLAPKPVVEAPRVVAPPPPPPPAPPPPPPPPPRFEKVTMSATELFAFDKAELNPNQPKLDEIAALLNNNSGIESVVISGYTDRTGTRKYNNELSLRRANTVKAYLVAKGVDAHRLNSVAKGEENPSVTCNNKKWADLIKCLEPNRRVEVEQITVERRVQ